MFKSQNIKKGRTLVQLQGMCEVFSQKMRFVMRDRITNLILPNYVNNRKPTCYLITTNNNETFPLHFPYSCLVVW